MAAGVIKQDTGGQGAETPLSCPWYELSVTGLEADLAYFTARLELIGKPNTSNQKAQVATFRFLQQALDKMLVRLKQKSAAEG